MLVLGRFLLWLKQDEKTSEYTVISKTVFALSVLVFISVLTLVHCIKASNHEIENVSLCNPLTALHMKMKYFSLTQNIELEHLKNKNCN